MTEPGYPSFADFIITALRFLISNQYIDRFLFHDRLILIT